MATILITGANGQLGNEIRRASESFKGYDFVFTDLDSLDITDKKATIEFIREVSPNWVINCAAYTAVDKAETEPEKALLVNSTAVHNIVESIKGSDCRFIHVSTDYVYNGKSSVPYLETDLADPVTSYGRSKYAGEQEALKYPGSLVIRTSWLYSSFGNNFVKTIIKNAAQKESLNVVFDQTGSPTYAADLALAIINIASGVIRNQLTLIAGIYNYSNEGVCSWYDFALEIVREMGYNCTINPIRSWEYKQLATRPSYSVLDKTKIKETYRISVPHWRDSLSKCVKLLK